MKLIKIGKRWVNMDCVTDIFQETTGDIFLSYGDNMDCYVSFRGDEAAALRDWLDDNTEAVLPMDSEGREYGRFTKCGGTLDRETWDSKWRILRNLRRQTDEQTDKQGSRLEDIAALYDQISNIQKDLFL